MRLVHQRSKCGKILSKFWGAVTKSDQLFVSAAHDTQTRCSSCQNQKISKSSHRKADVQNYAAKDLVVGTHANSCVMPKSAIVLLAAQSHAREGGLNVDMDAQKDARNHVVTALLLSKMFAFLVVTNFPNWRAGKRKISAN